MPKRPKHSPRRRAAVAKGYRSALEADVAVQLEEAGVEFDYEKSRLPYNPQTKHYTPDFELENGLIIEVKGRLTSADRQKHLRLKEQHPDLDIVFLFQVDNKLNSKSQTRYSDWCDRNGFDYAFKEVPERWYKYTKKDSAEDAKDDRHGDG